MDTSNGCLWSLTSWQAKYFWPFPCVTNVAFMVIVAHVGPRPSTMPCMARAWTGMDSDHPIYVVTALSLLSLIWTTDVEKSIATRYLNSSLCEFSFYLCQTICISERLSPTHTIPQAQSGETGKYYNVAIWQHSICGVLGHKKRENSSKSPYTVAK